MTTSNTAIRLISSMATKALLADLTAQFSTQSGIAVLVESVGGVDAARRAQGGEALDVVMLASSAIDQLIASGHVVPGSRADVAHSGVAVAVRAGAARPDIGSEEALRQAVLAAPSLACSTGPSGVQLARLFERWGIAGQIASRIVTAPPGVPVGTLVARGEVDLGFQQYSELMSQPGIDVLGPLPDAIQITTTFSAGIATHCASVESSQALLRFMCSAAVAELKRRHGMEAV